MHVTLVNAHARLFSIEYFADLCDSGKIELIYLTLYDFTNQIAWILVEKTFHETETLVFQYFKHKWFFFFLFDFISFSGKELSGLEITLWTRRHLNPKHLQASHDDLPSLCGHSVHKPLVSSGSPTVSEMCLGDYSDEWDFFFSKWSCLFLPRKLIYYILIFTW